MTQRPRGIVAGLSLSRSGSHGNWIFTMVGILPLILSLTAMRMTAQPSIKDTIYTPSGYADGPLSATIYIPRSSNGAGVVLTHYLGGTRQSLAVWCDTLAAHGYVAMTIDYYDWSNASFGIYPKPIRAFKTAVEFLRRNAVRFGITSGRIAGLGKSEGATHWGETIIWDNDDAYFQTDPAISDHLDAAVLLYGLYDNNNNLQSTLDIDGLLTPFFAPHPADRSDKGNCIAHTRNITTPLLLLQGANDKIVQTQQSVELHDSLVAQHKVCELQVDDTWGHMFDNLASAPYTFTPEGLVAKDLVLSFLGRYILEVSVPVPIGHSTPNDFELGQNYPNPFNPATTIRYGLPQKSQVSLMVYNTLGQRVSELVSGEQEAGYHEVSFSASGAGGAGLASGMYFYRLHSGDVVQVKKMVLIK